MERAAVGKERHAALLLAVVCALLLALAPGAAWAEVAGDTWTWSGESDDIAVTYGDNSESLITITGSGKLTLTDTTTSNISVEGSESDYSDGELSSAAITVVLDLNGQTLKPTNNDTHAVDVEYANFTLQDSSASGTGVITGIDMTSFTTGSHGAGLNVIYSNFTMTGGTVKGNAAKVGGGACVHYSTFTMAGGSFTQNKATKEDDYGGGALHVRSCSFTMTGGSITENYSAGVGGGISFSESSSDNGSSIAMSGTTALITDNDADVAGDDLYLSEKFNATTSLSLTGTWYYDDSDDRYESGDTAVSISSLESGNEYNLHSEFYTLTFDKNADEAEGLMDALVTGAEITNAFTVSENLYTRTGYVFSGWNTASDGTGTAYEEDETITLSSDVTLYAQWSPISYAIAFDANADDASGTMANQSMTYDVAANLDTNQFVRTGYTFAGWNTASDGTGTSYTDGEEVVNLTTTDGDEITLYAQWTEDTYTVTYTDGVDGEDVFEDTVDTITYTQKTGGDIPSYDPDGDGEEDVPERDGYIFLGWEETVDEYGNVTYTAQWEEIVEEADDDDDVEEADDDDDGDGLVQTGDYAAFVAACLTVMGGIAIACGALVLKRGSGQR